MAYPPFDPVWFRPRPIAAADFVRKTLFQFQRASRSHHAMRPGSAPILRMLTQRRERD
jgi:hypothetical protein